MSANNLIKLLCFKQLGNSFIKIRNNNGPGDCPLENSRGHWHIQGRLNITHAMEKSKKMTSIWSQWSIGYDSYWGGLALEKWNLLICFWWSIANDRMVIPDYDHSHLWLSSSWALTCYESVNYPPTWGDCKINYAFWKTKNIFCFFN